MSELAAGFQSLPAEYQTVIRLAQDQHHIAVTPLQALAGGWSGAMVYLVSVASQDHLQHLVLKLDRKNVKAQSDEIRRHETAFRQSPSTFAERHLAQMVFDRVEADGAMAIFYAIAGQSLHRYRTLSSYESQCQVETIFAETYHHILSEWNAARTFKQAVTPVALLEQWLSFRLKPDGNIQKFLETYCRVSPDIDGFLVQGSILPNPLAYARHPEWWGAARPIDAAIGLQHGDLNTNNILIKFAKDGETLDGYFLIDFALFKEQMPLVFDVRYLEMSYLILRHAQVSFTKLVDLILRFGEADNIDSQDVPIDVAGLASVIGSTRRNFEQWVSGNHPSLHDDLWGQYWLAGVAAGLSYCHKPDIGQPQRMLALIYAAANLKRYSKMFGVKAPTEARQLYDPVKLRHERTATITMRGVPHNLPAQTTTLIGRDAEAAAIQQLLTSDETRLITLSGPGGVGKTRLSLEVAARVGNANVFPDGVFFIPLADITDPTLVVAKIAQTLGLREGGNQPLIMTVKSYLHDKRMLLILDNFEQLISAAPMVADLLAMCPRLKLLVSSRIVLELRGEREFVVPPLETPDSDQLPDLSQIEQNQAVQLFVERAQIANSKFSLTAENAAAIAEICQRLDGLPLAIELAAARTKLLSPQMMLGRLDNRLALLTGGARDLPVRQQTLRNSLDLSYSLLEPDEQTLFARLGVFVGGFSLEAAESLCSADTTLNVLDTITALTNNSFLRSEDCMDGHPRFRMLETIREYALERLRERGELASMQSDHAAYYFKKLITEIGEKLFSPEAHVWLDWLECEHANVSAAFVWGLNTSDKAVLACCRILTWYWYRRGYLSEGRAWIQRLLDSPLTQGRTPERALALVTHSSLAMWQGDLKAAEISGKTGLELAQQTEELPIVAWAFLTNGVLNINQGNYTVARPLIKEALALYKETQQIWFIAIVLVHLGNIELGLGDMVAARAWLEEADDLSRQWGEDWAHSFVLNNLGEVARVQGDYQAARRYYEESEAFLRAMGDKGDLARLIHSLGYVAQHEGNLAKAAAQFQESLAMFRALGNKRGMAECLLGLAGIRAAQGQASLAAQLFGTAETTMSASGAGWWPADRGEMKRTREAIQAQLDEATFAAELAKGAQMPLERAIASVTR
ncbi:MAG: tetratricopeptide repeat protein [Anaerolineae bacterium]|nr:tetratricopeptide repeat protein [Anaerolineae bacterium]